MESLYILATKSLIYDRLVEDATTLGLEFQKYEVNPDDLTQEPISTEYSQTPAIFEGVRFVMNQLKELESPIEWLMYGILFDMRIRGYHTFIECADDTVLTTLRTTGGTPYNSLEIMPQYPVENYRVDFCVGFYAQGKFHKVFIECDGHDFHEKTKSQAAYDKKRDRVLQLHADVVLHFTGSEIHNNSIGCQAEIEKTITRIIEKEGDKKSV